MWGEAWAGATATRSPARSQICRWHPVGVHRAPLVSSLPKDRRAHLVPRSVPPAHLGLRCAHGHSLDLLQVAPRPPSTNPPRAHPLTVPPNTFLGALLPRGASGTRKRCLCGGSQLLCPGSASPSPALQTRARGWGGHREGPCRAQGWCPAGDTATSPRCTPPCPVVPSPLPAGRSSSVGISSIPTSRSLPGVSRERGDSPQSQQAPQGHFGHGTSSAGSTQ